VVYCRNYSLVYCAIAILGAFSGKAVFASGSKEAWLLCRTSHLFSLSMQGTYQERFFMKMSGQSRSFTKQVQMDLLALNDTDLFDVVHQWVNGGDGSRFPSDVSEETRFALGYSMASADGKLEPGPLYDMSEAERAEAVQWQAPSPQQLRQLLTAMDMHAFTQHVIALAFQALHPGYPEWDEGMIFNAHLANYLRQIKSERQREASVGSTLR
jgi:hypothetical protein